MPDGTIASVEQIPGPNTQEKPKDLSLDQLGPLIIGSPSAARNPDTGLLEHRQTAQAMSSLGPDAIRLDTTTVANFDGQKPIDVTSTTTIKQPNTPSATITWRQTLKEPPIIHISTLTTDPTTPESLSTASSILNVVTGVLEHQDQKVSLYSPPERVYVNGTELAVNKTADGKLSLSLPEEPILEEKKAEKSATEEALEKVAIKLEAQLEKESPLDPRAELICDANHIADQRVDFIVNHDKSSITVSFRLTEDAYATAVEKYLAYDPYDPEIYSNIEYPSRDGSETAKVSKSYLIKNEGSLIAKLAQPPSSPGDKVFKSHYSYSLVTVQIPVIAGDLQTSLISQSENLDHLMEQVGISNWSEPPSPQDEQSYLIKQYAWNHKLTEIGNTPSQLQRSEVFPDYSIPVDQEKYLAYKAEYGRYLAIHEIGFRSGHETSRVLVDIIQAGGITSNHERARRGHFSGLPSDNSLGRGDNQVFSRVFSEEAFLDSERKTGYPPYCSSLNPDRNTALFILDPKLFDRLDTFAYPSDNSGSTDPDEIGQRLSPDELLKMQVAGNQDNGFNSNNEMMFPLGVQLKDIRAIVVPKDQRDSLIESLKKAGITTINGAPVETFVRANNNIYDFFDIAWDEDRHTPSI